MICRRVSHDLASHPIVSTHLVFIYLAIFKDTLVTHALMNLDVEAHPSHGHYIPAFSSTSNARSLLRPLPMLSVECMEIRWGFSGGEVS